MTGQERTQRLVCLALFRRGRKLYLPGPVGQLSCQFGLRAAECAPSAEDLLCDHEHGHLVIPALRNIVESQPETASLAGLEALLHNSRALFQDQDAAAVVKHAEDVHTIDRPITRIPDLA